MATVREMPAITASNEIASKQRGTRAMPSGVAGSATYASGFPCNLSVWQLIEH